MGFICCRVSVRCSVALPGGREVSQKGASGRVLRPSRLGIKTHLPLATGELHVHEAASVCESLLCATLTVWLLALGFRSLGVRSSSVSGDRGVHQTYGVFFFSVIEIWSALLHASHEHQKFAEVRTLLLNLGGLRLDLAGTGAVDNFVRILFFPLAASQIACPRCRSPYRDP